MTQCIIYLQDNGVPAVVMPTPECLQSYSIQEIAVKDVPANKPFAIVNVSDLPDAPQEAWVVSEADLTDGIGGESHEFN
jgi:hypothetical protein